MIDRGKAFSGTGSAHGSRQFQTSVPTGYRLSRPSLLAFGAGLSGGLVLLFAIGGRSGNQTVAFKILLGGHTGTRFRKLFSALALLSGLLTLPGLSLTFQDGRSTFLGHRCFQSLYHLGRWDVSRVPHRNGPPQVLLRAGSLGGWRGPQLQALTLIIAGFPTRVTPAGARTAKRGA